MRRHPGWDGSTSAYLTGPIPQMAMMAGVWMPANDAVVVRRSSDTSDKAAGRNRYARCRIEVRTAVAPPRARDHDAISVCLVGMWCTHVAGPPANQGVIEAGLVGVSN